MARFLAFFSAFFALVALASASSHSEALGALEKPQLDITDVYAFQSYESGRNGFTTLIMNVNPLQDRFGGPNYAPLSDAAFYEFYIDNNHDGKEDLTFSFLFGSRLGGNPDSKGRFSGITVPVGRPGRTRDVAIPLAQAGAIGVDGKTGSLMEGNLNLVESYQLKVIRGDRDNGGKPFDDGTGFFSFPNGSSTFRKPFDNAGTKTFSLAGGYSEYAKKFIHSVSFPGCAVSGSRVFVGPRREGFGVNLGKIFDLLNLQPLPRGSIPSNPLFGETENVCNNVVAEKTITTFALELPTSCLVDPSQPDKIIGVWGGVRQMIHKKKGHFFGNQVNRLGNPLFNEVVVGLPDKDIYNVVEPTEDYDYFRKYVQYPTLPVLVSLLFLDGINGLLGTSLTTLAPNVYPRDDLMDIFLQGVPGINEPVKRKKSAEYIRLNTAIAPKSCADQKRYAVFAGDVAGYPNGRRPGDDVVDISVQAVMGRLCHAPLGYCKPEDAPVGAVDFTDGAPVDCSQFQEVFPYLQDPYPGSALFYDLDIFRANKCVV